MRRALLEVEDEAKVKVLTVEAKSQEPRAKPRYGIKYRNNEKSYPSYQSKPTKAAN